MHENLKYIAVNSLFMKLLILNEIKINCELSVYEITTNWLSWGGFQTVTLFPHLL